MAKFFIIIFVIICGFIFVFFWLYSNTESKNIKISQIKIPDTSTDSAKIFLKNAKKQIGVVTKYDLTNGYYSNGWFPPPDTGVCSDVIWRAFDLMDINLKSQIDEHMKKFPNLYQDNFDSNINFRRVKNLKIYFDNNFKKLPNEMISGNGNNLVEWQPGDIIIFDATPPKNLWHIAIISDKRDESGVPFMLDNHGYWVGETMTPLDWKASIVGHYRPF